MVEIKRGKKVYLKAITMPEKEQGYLDLGVSVFEYGRKLVATSFEVCLIIYSKSRGLLLRQSWSQP